MKESDWKHFKKIKENAINQFCIEALAEFEDVIKDKTISAHDRYLLLYKLVQNIDKEMVRIFDYHSRSKAQMQLLAMRVRGLVPEDHLEKLSPEMQEWTDPKRYE